LVDLFYTINPGEPSDYSCHCLIGRSLWILQSNLVKKLDISESSEIFPKIGLQNYSTFQVSEVHNRGRDTAVPCPYGNRRAIGVYFINVESAVSELHRTYIGSVERGERNITLLNASKIAKALSVSLAELVTDDD